MMRRGILFILCSGLAVVAACSDIPEPNLGPERSYSVASAQETGITIPQDDTVRVTVTVKRDDDVTIANPTLVWRVEDFDIAAVTQAGVVTGKKGGTTTVLASFSGDTIRIPITVTARPVGSLSVTVNHTGKDSAVAFALGANAAGTWLKGIVRGTDGSILYCNGIVFECTPPGAPRVQRLVTFTSLEPTEATISNGATTAGQITALDTTGTRYIGFVMSVAADNIADTAWIRFVPRPIDSLTVVPGTFQVFGANNALITLNYTQFIARDSSILLVPGRISRTDSVTARQTLTGTPPTLSSGRTPTTAPTITSPMPTVTWQSANNNYAEVEPSGRVRGIRNFWVPTDIPAPLPGSGVFVTVNSITRTGTTATVATSAAHNLVTGASVTISGANQPEYNGKFTITRLSATTFSYTVAGSPATPATTSTTMTAGTALVCSMTPFAGRISAVDTAFNFDKVLTAFNVPQVSPFLEPTGCEPPTGAPPLPPANYARGVSCTSTVDGPNATCTVLIKATVTDPAGSSADLTGGPGNTPDGIPDNVKTFYFPVIVRRN